LKPERVIISPKERRLPAGTELSKSFFGAGWKPALLYRGVARDET
jgi:hypothetical protein